MQRFVGVGFVLSVVLLDAASAPVALTASSAASNLASYRVVPARSEASIAVGKTGAFSIVAGHTHQVDGPVTSGAVELDRDVPSLSRVRLMIDTSTLKVNPNGEPPGDVPKVQQTMESEKVLDAAGHPHVGFVSTSVTDIKRQDGAMDLTVTGRLTIRDVTRPISVPIHVELRLDSLTTSGHFSVKQTDYGIKPVSVAGVVTVKNELDVRFTVVADRVQ